MAEQFDVAVIGAGPAGLAAAIAAEAAGARTALVEREGRLGGILKQCIHDGFGLVRFGEKLSGPEYSGRFIAELRKTAVETLPRRFVTRIESARGGFEIVLSGKDGLTRLGAKALVLATGCRERTARQVGIHGARPAGVLTAGAAQYYVNILGRLPCRRAVILGSGDIGLIMARRLTLEGAEVRGVYEAKPAPSGLSRNIAQCLDDFGIPLHTSRTVTRVFGRERLEAVEIARVDAAMRPIPGTEERLDCDGLILSVGLIPENELAESLGVAIHPATRGPVADQHYATSRPGVFCCGNALQVNDLADYVSEGGETAGRSAARFAREGMYAAGGNFARFEPDAGFLCMAPQRLDLSRLEEATAVFFRAKDERGPTRLRVFAGGREVFTKRYAALRPPEMERVVLLIRDVPLAPGAAINLVLEDA